MVEGSGEKPSASDKGPFHPVFLKWEVEVPLNTYWPTVTDKQLDKWFSKVDKEAARERRLRLEQPYTQAVGKAVAPATAVIQNRPLQKQKP